MDSFDVYLYMYNQLYCKCHIVYNSSFMFCESQYPGDDKNSDDKDTMGVQLFDYVWFSVLFYIILVWRDAEWRGRLAQIIA